MRTRWIGALTVVALLAAGCGDGDETPTAADSTTTTSTVAVTTSTEPPTTTEAPPTTTEVPPPTTTVAGLDLPLIVRCDGLAAPPTDRALTFVAEGRLWAVDADGEITCLAEEMSAPPEVWSPTGDRLLTDAGTVVSPTGTVDLGIGGLETGGRQLLGWTWPTGRRVLSTDGPTLTKHEADGSGPSDATVADDHRVLAYHPDGVHFAVFGTALQSFVEFDEQGNETVEVFPRVGLFIARNNEPEPQLMIDPTGAVIRDVVFSEDGSRLTFVADHDGDFHIHSFNLPDMLIETDDGETLLTALQEDPELLDPQVESSRPLTDLTVDPADPWRVLFAEGLPGAGRSVWLHDFASGADVRVAPDLDAAPVGFLDATRVVIHTASDELWIVDLATDERTAVAAGVGRGAIRDAAPDLVFSLVDITIVGFA